MIHPGCARSHAIRNNEDKAVSNQRCILSVLIDSSDTVSNIRLETLMFERPNRNLRQIFTNAPKTLHKSLSRRFK